MKHLTCWLLLLSLCAAAVRAAQAPMTFSVHYTLARAARVSLLLTDARGQVVRELLHAAPRAAGAHSEDWDGLSDEGKPVPAGDYTWKLLATQGLKAEYLLTLGTNPTPAYDSWPGNHGGVSSVAVDAQGAMYVAGGCGEGDPLLIKQAPDGTRLWSVDQWLDSWMGGYSLAVAGGKCLLLQQNGVIQRLDAATGTRDARWDVVWENADRDNGKDTHLTMDLAARGEQVVLSFANHNAIRWIDPQTGKVLDEAPVPEPLGVAIDAAGRVLVISKNTVVALTREDHTPKPIITGLSAPWRLDVAANGDILVAERGASQQVKRYNGAGKTVCRLLHRYGTPGGRPRDGRYDPLGFADIDDIAADGQGGFYLVEAWTAPRRTAHFSADGTLLREWYGGQQYANTGVADPADPTSVWCESHWGSLIQAKVDYAKKTWRVYACYSYAGLAEGMVPNHEHGHSGWQVRHHDGKTYLCRETGFPCILQVDEAGRRLLPKTVAFIIGRPDLPIVKDGLARAGASAPGANLALWCDLHDDGKASAEEMRGVAAPEVWGSGHPWYGDDFTFYTPRVNTWGDHSGVSIIKVASWTPGGTPIYAFDKAITFTDKYPDAFAEMQTHGVALDEQGNLFGADDTRVFAPYGVGGGAGVGGNKVVKFDRTGKLLWAVGMHAPGSTAQPGEVMSFYSMASVHGCAVASDYANSMLHVWDGDGLWVGRLLEQPDLTAAPASAYTLCGENFGNTLYQAPADCKVPGLNPGDVLLFGGGQNNTPVFRITGWDGWVRQHGTLTLTPAQAATLNARVTAEAKRPDLAHIPYLRQDLAKVDGTLDKWKGITPLLIKDGNTVRAYVYLGWNNTGLYAAFDVHTDTPWKSAASPTLAFQGGAAVDVNFGPYTPARTHASPGDMRVVASPCSPGHLMEFLPELAPGMSAQQQTPVSYRTEQGNIQFARVAPLDDSVMVMRPRLSDDPQHQVTSEPLGYIIEMRLAPRAPFELRPGYRFLLDTSVILADPDGKHSAVRLCWHSRDLWDMTVTDTYLESLLRPGNWGEAVLEP